MPRPRPQRLSLRITSLAPGGDGVAHAEVAGERRAVFVPGAAPGDEIDALVDLTRRPARASEVRILTPSEGRRPSPCPHASACGGCPWIHLTPEAQARARQALLEDTVLRALPASPPFAVVHHPAPSHERYRTRARFALSGGAAPEVGFRGAMSRKVVPIGSCLVLDPRLDRALLLLREALASARGKGEARAALGRGGLPVLSISWSGELAGASYAALEAQLTRGELAGAELRLDGAREPAVIGDPRVFGVGADGLPLETPGFAQANPEVSADLARTLAALARPRGRAIVELYSGAGTLTVMLAPGASSYVAVESDLASSEAARRNLAARGLGPSVRLVVGPAETARLALADLVVLDPPRAGAAELVPAILRSKARELLYVSCDPVTLARDAARLAEGGFSPVALHAFAMFPQTSHLETLLHARRGPPRREG